MIEADLLSGGGSCVGTANPSTSAAYTLAEAFDDVAAYDHIFLCPGTHLLDEPDELLVDDLPRGLRIYGAGASTVVTAAVDATLEPCDFDPFDTVPLPAEATCFQTVESVPSLMPLLWHTWEPTPPDLVEWRFYGSFFEDGRRHTLIPYPTWEAFSATEELFDLTHVETYLDPEETDIDHDARPQMFYGPGTHFFRDNCQNALDSLASGGSGVVPESFGPTGTDACRLYVRVDHTNKAELHGLDADGDGSINVGSVLLYHPMGWFFRDTSELTIEDMRLVELRRLDFSRVHDVTVQDLSFHGASGIRVDNALKSTIQRNTVSLGLQRTLYFQDLKQQATGASWLSGGCVGAAQGICSHGIRVESDEGVSESPIPTVDPQTGEINWPAGDWVSRDTTIAHNTVQESWCGIGIGEVHKAKIHHNAVQFAHNDAIGITPSSLDVEVYRNYITASLNGLVLEGESPNHSYDSARTVSSHFLHHNVVDLNHGLDVWANNAHPLSADYGDHMGIWRESVDDDPIKFNPAEKPTYGVGAALVATHGISYRAAPIVAYNNTLISKSAVRSGSRQGTVYLPVYAVDPTQGLTWSGPATWFTSNLVVQESGISPAMRGLVWWDRGSGSVTDPTVVSDGNVFVRYPDPDDTEAPLFTFYGGLYDGQWMPSVGGVSTREQYEAGVDADYALGATSFLFQEYFDITHAGDPDPGASGVVPEQTRGFHQERAKGNEYGSLADFWSNTATGNGRWRWLKEVECTAHDGSVCTTWGTPFQYLLFSESEVSDWTGTGGLLICGAGTCSPGLDSNSSEKTSEAVFGASTFLWELGYSPFASLPLAKVSLTATARPPTATTEGDELFVGACNPSASGSSCVYGP